MRRTLLTSHICLNAATELSDACVCFSDTGTHTQSGDFSVMLNEDAGWIDSRTKSAPGACAVCAFFALRSQRVA